VTDHNYFFEGRLITGSESLGWIKNALSSLNGEASICSAYIKIPILKEIGLNTNSSDIRFLARWDLNDLVGGASDIECYKFSKERGWKFHINPRLHTKIFYLPPSGILSGSANATSSGLGLSSHSNREASTVVAINDHNIGFINNLFSDSILMTDELYMELVDAYSSIDKTKTYMQWPDSVLKKLTPKLSLDSKFMISECLLSSGDEILNLGKSNSVESIHDLSVLAIPLNCFDKEYIYKKFIYSKLFLWINTLLAKYDGEIYFGTLTQELHNALIENPMPYRSEVKDMVKNIYSWIKIVGPDQTKILYDRPNVSERLRLIN
jgi:hypothetical protein